MSKASWRIYIVYVAILMAAAIALGIRIRQYDHDRYGPGSQHPPTQHTLTHCCASGYGGND